jgi:hypothetical protein
MLKQTTFFLFLFLLTNLSYSQMSLYSDSVKVTDSTILIATSSLNKQYEFCIEKTNHIIESLKKLAYGPEKQYSYEKSPVVIKLVTKGKIVKSWNVHLISSVIEVEDKKYFFDTTLLSMLHKKFPVKYFIEEKVFTSPGQQEEYYSNLLKDKTFLYIVPHDFENVWREKFNLTFKKSKTFSSPHAIADYLDTLLLKIIPKEKYSISYSPFVDAKKDSANELTMTVYSMYELYTNFKDENSRKSGLTFYPTYIIKKQ